MSIKNITNYKYFAPKGVNIAVQPYIDGVLNTRIGIPIEPCDNADYKEWKAWVEAGNTTEAAD